MNDIAFIACLHCGARKGTADEQEQCLMRRHGIHEWPREAAKTAEKVDAWLASDVGRAAVARIRLGEDPEIGLRLAWDAAEVAMALPKCKHGLTGPHEYGWEGTPTTRTALRCAGPQTTPSDCELLT